MMLTNKLNNVPQSSRWLYARKAKFNRYEDGKFYDLTDYSWREAVFLYGPGDDDYDDRVWECFIYGRNSHHGPEEREYLWPILTDKNVRQ